MIDSNRGRSSIRRRYKTFLGWSDQAYRYLALVGLVEMAGN